MRLCAFLKIFDESHLENVIMQYKILMHLCACLVNGSKYSKWCKMKLQNESNFQG